MNGYSSSPLSFSLHLCTFSVIFLLSKPSSGADYRYEACVPRNCGQGPNISFPFHISGLQESYCGYPGFNLNCSNDGFPVLELSENNYVNVQDIFYGNQSLLIYNSAVSGSAGGDCVPIRTMRNTTLATERFSYFGVIELNLFSNCSIPLKDQPILLRHELRCNGDGRNDRTAQLAVYDGEDESLRKAMEVCAVSVIAPVQIHEEETNGGVVNDLVEVLRRGFVMKWKASDCSTCEDSGGRCGFNETSLHFRCFCTDRPHSRSCKPAETSKCPESFSCGTHGRLEFPFTNTDKPDCGLFTIDRCNNSSEKQRIRLGADGEWYTVLQNISSNILHIRAEIFKNLIESNSCFAFLNLSLPKSPSVSFTFSPNLTLFACLPPYYSEPPEEWKSYGRYSCPGFAVYYSILSKDDSWERSQVSNSCSLIQLPSIDPYYKPECPVLFGMLTSEFTLEWNISDECYKCHHGGGQCLTNNMNSFRCKGNGRLKLILAIIAISGGSIILILSFAIISYIIWQRKKKLKKGYLRSRDLSSHPSSKSDVEGASFFYGIPIFSYSDLEKATNQFDPSKELGDGGFGTVYYGKLEDGREVAIKRLYEHNYKRMEQFMTEIEILTSLRHPNLVSLYGCTSRRSRELLLVYEYVHNGTVADHIHGDRAKEVPLTWDIRMRIAIETSTALAYLHKSDIVHRDVKTNNILLDSNFIVKVADFGLSRIFPNDVSHISTAPQGTPGYVDPEYHQSYQLTGKSDVYSFGVVLVELISSMPAVDLTRHRHEINLANLAINRIHRCAFDELIDPSLGYETDNDVKRMTTSVAELAFRCLQTEKDLRPAMDEVLEFLLSIQSGEGFEFEKMVKNGNENHGKISASPETDDAVLLKNKRDFIMSSPNAVTDAWISSSSTTTSSMG